MSLPILYSFRRCPYAMRARLAIAISGVSCEIREVVLKDKPPQLIEISPKATVPVLHINEQHVIDESIDIALWALEQHDPQNWYQQLGPELKKKTQELITLNDGEFKYYLDRYKYADRYPDQTREHYREQGEKTLYELEALLTKHQNLLGECWTLADIALLPFIRQFALVDKTWFDSSPYPKVRLWLERFLDSQLFESVMHKYIPWQDGDTPVIFP